MLVRYNNVLCKIYAYRNWYCLAGSNQVNRVIENIYEGMDITNLNVVEFHTSVKSINSDRDLSNFLYRNAIV